MGFSKTRAVTAIEMVQVTALRPEATNLGATHPESDAEKMGRCEGAVLRAARGVEEEEEE